LFYVLFKVCNQASKLLQHNYQNKPNEGCF